MNGAEIDSKLRFFARFRAYLLGMGFRVVVFFSSLSLTHFGCVVVYETTTTTTTTPTRLTTFGARGGRLPRQNPSTVCTLLYCTALHCRRRASTCENSPTLFVVCVFFFFWAARICDEIKNTGFVPASIYRMMKNNLFSNYFND